ncbi:unnamed protein product, partial [Tetraodon nigroviridis]
LSQGGAPSPFDRNFSTKIAAKAVQWISEKLTDCYKGGERRRPASACCSFLTQAGVCVQDECLPTRTTRRVCWGCGAEPWCSSRWRTPGRNRLCSQGPQGPVVAEAPPTDENPG